MARKKTENKPKMRISTIIKQLKIPTHLASAVMVKHHLKNSDRIDPDEFNKMVESWRKQPVGGV
ncbi:MAG: hypothetical protein H8E18_02215 [FCB group bacterium]|nr:hypothetical protein [FCB group bacterium]